MRLLDRISIWFIVIFILVTPITMYLSYYNIRHNIDGAEAERLTDVNNSVARQLASGAQLSHYTEGRPIKVEEINAELPAQKNIVSESCEYNRRLEKKECKLTVTSYYGINGHNYKVTSYNYVTKSKEIVGGMLDAVAYKMVLMILAVSLTARMLSRRLFAPFQTTIETLRNFSLKNRQKIQLPDTRIKEFRELNTLVKKMTDKAVEDYSALKEFSENASHELQTPLAIIRSKLELLTETNIDEGQASLILDMHNAIDKLSRINRSLVLLTKLENHEFEVAEPANICRMAKEVLGNFSDRIALKNITVTSSIAKNINAFIHPALAEILVNNLLSNAVRHNVDGGRIEVHMDHQLLRVSNTGLPLAVPAGDMFQRFRKSDQCADSIGLGLAIVKQICDVNGFTVTYENSGDVHTVQVVFKSGKIIVQEPAQLAEVAI